MNDLQVYVDQKDVAEVFTEGGANDILDKIEAEARSLVPDVSTAKGRKQIASTAHHVARSKTYLDGLGKGLSVSLRKQAYDIDEERRTIRHRLDKLKRDVRDPLTIYETKEKTRIERIKAAINKFECPVPKSLDRVKDRIKRFNEIEIDESFCEFKDEAKAAKEASLNRLRLAESEIEQASALDQLEKKKRELEDALRKIEQMKEAAAKAEREAKESAARAETQAAIRGVKAKESATRAEREAKEVAARAKANVDDSRSKASASLARLCSLNALKAGEILDKIESGEIQGVSCDWSSK